MPLTDSDTMPFGAHHGKVMEKVPADYLLYCWNQGWKNCTGEDSKRGEVARYIRDNMEAIKSQDPDTIVDPEGA